jgi:hypothetical protein
MNLNQLQNVSTLKRHAKFYKFLIPYENKNIQALLQSLLKCPRLCKAICSK